MPVVGGPAGAGIFGKTPRQHPWRPSAGLQKNPTPGKNKSGPEKPKT